MKVYIIGRMVCRTCGHRQMSAWPVARDVRFGECAACGDLTAEMDGAAYRSQIAPEIHVEIWTDQTLYELQPLPRVES